MERVPKSELQVTVDHHVAVDSMHYLHPFDDLHLIAGMARYVPFMIYIINAQSVYHILSFFFAGGGCLLDTHGTQGVRQNKIIILLRKMDYSVYHERGIQKKI